MHYMIRIDESKLPELEKILVAIDPLAESPKAYAVNNDGTYTGTPMDHVRDYYTHNMNQAIPGLLPWRELSPATQEALGEHLAGCVGWLFPDMTFDSQLSAELSADILGIVPTGECLDLPRP